MQIKVDSSVFSQTTWQEYATRFLIGGVITALTGIIGMKWGPAIGGLFLAFPAILPAAATLIEKHAKEKKEEKGLRGTDRARKEVSIDAAGAAMGSIGLVAFALVVDLLILELGPWVVLILATVTWLAVSLLLWFIRKRM